MDAAHDDPGRRPTAEGLASVDRRLTRRGTVSRRPRVPEEAIRASVDAVLAGGPDCNVSDVARAFDVSPITLNRAVRRRLERDGLGGLSSGVARREGRAATLAAVEAMVASEGLTLKAACLRLGANYEAIAKARSRARMIERFSRIRSAMLAFRSTPDDLALLGTVYRRRGDSVLGPGIPLASWLGADFRRAASEAGEDPTAIAKPFALWLAGHY